MAEKILHTHYASLHFAATHYWQMIKTELKYKTLSLKSNTSLNAFW